MGIKGKQIEDDSLTGADIDESSLIITLDDVCSKGANTSRKITSGSIVPGSDKVHTLGSLNENWLKVFTDSIESTDSLQINPTTQLNKKTLQGTSLYTAVLEDTTFSGIGTSNFSVSMWFYAEDTHGTISSNTKIRFLSSNAERHVVNLGVPDITVQYKNSANGLSVATFDTNLAPGNWYHIAILFDVSNLTTGVPKLWLNGVEINSTGYSAVGGTTPNIGRVTVYLDDGTGMQDLVFFDTLLSQDEVEELYNDGYYLQPNNTSASGDIVSWFPLGEENVLAGFNPGDTLSGTIILNDEIGTNSFTLTSEAEFSILGRSVQEYAFTGIDLNANSIRIRKSFTPASSSDFGQKGEIAWDNDYLYVCVDLDTWKRVSIGTW